MDHEQTLESCLKVRGHQNVPVHPAIEFQYDGYGSINRLQAYLAIFVTFYRRSKKWNQPSRHYLIRVSHRNNVSSCIISPKLDKIVTERVSMYLDI